jgi:tetratricopeptide (TPR) repeat protein
MNSRDVEAHYWRGRAFDASARDELALADYSCAIRLRPSHVDAYYHRGRIWYHRNALDLAIQDFTQVIKLDPDNLWALYYRGMTYTSKFEPDKAIADYTRAIQLDPNLAAAVRPYLQAADPPPAGAPTRETEAPSTGFLAEGETMYVPLRMDETHADFRLSDVESVPIAKLNPQILRQEPVP